MAVSPPRKTPGCPRGAAYMQMLAIVVALLVVAGVLAWWLLPPIPDPAEAEYARLRNADAPDSVVVLAPLERTLRESSGLAVGREHSGTVWTHNDSGDRARIYALDLAGRVRATFDLTGVEARDFEGMDRGPCPGTPERSCLYVGDIGDNARRRDVVTIHVVPEPDPAAGSGSVAPLGRLRYVYPDGPRDAEALAVTPGGDVVLVTKGRAPEIRLFRIDAARVARAVADDEPLQLDEGVALPIEPDWPVGRIVTGASFRPDGGVLAVRTLSEIFFFSWPGLEVAAPTCFLGRREPQGEAIAWDADGSLLLTSETNRRGPGMLTRVWCRTV